MDEATAEASRLRLEHRLADAEEAAAIADSVADTADEDPSEEVAAARRTADIHTAIELACASLAKADPAIEGASSAGVTLASRTAADDDAAQSAAEGGQEVAGWPSAFAQAEGVTRALLPLLLKPLASSASDDPKPSLLALAALSSQAAVPGALRQLIESELASLAGLRPAHASLAAAGAAGYWGVASQGVANGRAFQSRSVVGCLLSVGLPAAFGQAMSAASRQKTANLDRLTEASDRDLAVTIDSLKRGLGSLHASSHALLKRCATSGAEGREALLAWMSFALQSSSPRAEAISSQFQRMTAGDEAQRRTATINNAAGDDLLLNLYATSLRFCAPFLKFDAHGEPAEETLTRLEPSSHYLRSSAVGRIDFRGRYTTLAGRIATGAGMSGADDYFEQVAMAAEEEEAELHRKNQPEAGAPGGVATGTTAAAAAMAADDRGERAAGDGVLSFVGEAFFVAQYAMHVGPVPAYRLMRFQAEMFAQRSLMAAGPEGLSRQHHNMVYRIQQSFLAHHLQPETLQLTVSFLRLQASWLRRLAERQPPSAALAAFELVPSFVVSDMCATLVAIALHAPDELAMHQLKPLVLSLGALLRSGCAALCGGTRLVRSPVVLGQLVDVLYYLLVPGNARRSASQSLGSSSGWGGDVSGRLSQAVLGESAVRVALVVPLAAVYSAFDAVEGLDVDAVENESADGGGFEKFSLRERVNTLLHHLWKSADARQRLCAAASGGTQPSDPVQPLAEGVASSSATAGPSEGEAQMGGQDDDESAVEAPSAGPSVVRALANGMLDTLLYQLEEALKRIKEANLAEWDSSAQELKQHQGYTKHLLQGSTSTLELMQALLEEESMAAVFGRAPVANRTAAASLQFLDGLCGKRALDLKLRGRFTNEDFGFDPRGLLRGIITVLLRCAPTSHELLEAIAHHPDLDVAVLTKAARIIERERLLPLAEQSQLTALLETVTGLAATEAGATAASTAGAASEAADGEHPIWDALRTELDSPPDEGATAASGGEAAGAEAAAAESAAEDARVSAYAAALEESVFDSVELLDSSKSHTHHYCDQVSASASSGTLPALRKKLMREVRDLQGGMLPLHPNASIFIRQDESTMNVWRAVLSGPVDTPYAFGLFVFDIFCPPEYPAVPPLVHLETTGGGTVKFNPNLYADGKVCLSLLGTFNAGHATEKWDATRSSLYQVVVSIQSQILTEHPIVNEPGYDERHATSAAGREYNAKLRLQTLRHAMSAQLKQPPVGFEEVVRLHFAQLRTRVLRMAREWTREAPEELRAKMEAALTQLRDLLPPQACADEE